MLAGKIPACQWVKAACVRQRQDLARWAKGGEYYFDPEKAERVCEFVSLIPHVEGEWASRGETIKLEPWQAFILTTIFGWVRRDDGARRFRRVYVEIPRKNAKSTLSSAVALYMLLADGEEGAQVYSLATKKDQAKIVWTAARKMVLKSLDLKQSFGVTAGAHAITVGATGSVFTAQSSDDESLDGLNPSMAVIDELHAHKTRGVWDVIVTAVGARLQPLVWAITTAGFNLAGVCYEQRRYVCSVLLASLLQAGGLGYSVKGESFEDDSVFGVVFTIDEDMDPHSEAAWAMANPNYGVSVKKDYIAGMSREAERTASKLNNFLTKHLNVWVNAETAWIDMRHWLKCGNPKLNKQALAGEPCVVAVDLALTRDIAAVQVLFPREGGKFATFGKYFLPSDVIEASDNSQYEGWVHDDYLTATEGNEIDHEQIAAYIDELTQTYAVQVIGFDPRMATMLRQQLQAKGISASIVDITQNVPTFAEPMNRVEEMVIAGNIEHDDNPCMNWMMSNVLQKKNDEGLGRPVKDAKSDAKKIDGPVALIMAMHLEMHHKPQMPGVYAIEY